MTDFLRQSQVLTTFGPGAMIDLPEGSVLIEGLQSWHFGQERDEIQEARLVARMRQQLQLPEVRLVKPPAFDDRPGAPRTSIGAKVFPAWFLVQQTRATGLNGQWRRRRLVRWDELVGNRFRDEDSGSRHGRGKAVVPVRFVCGFSTEASIIARFAQRFVGHEWPGPRLPSLYFDPRTVRAPTAGRPSLHAKCVIVDGRTALITSANLTLAAQERNIEIGILIKSDTIAKQIDDHFQCMIDHRLLQILPVRE